MNVMAALIISFLFPLAFLFAIHTLDLYGTGKFHHNFTALAWGIVAYLLARSLQSNLIANGWINNEQIIRTVAPIAEELLKALILIYLVRRADFNYVVDGAIYGFGVGIGFAVSETTTYVVDARALALPLALYRVFSTNLIHATASGLIGSGLAAGRLEHGAKSLLLALGGFILAMSLHMGFNIMVMEGASPILPVLAGFMGIGCIVLIIRISLKIQRDWISVTLGMTDQVTTGEAAVVQRIANMDQVLAPIDLQFGADKASKTRSLIYMQAELGIKRAIARKTTDQKKRAEIEMEIKRIASRMSALRREIGLYCMIFVRSIYLARGSRLWDLINARVGAAGTGPVGGGLWSNLDSRIRGSKTQDRES